MVLENCDLVDKLTQLNLESIQSQQDSSSLEVHRQLAADIESILRTHITGNLLHEIRLMISTTLLSDAERPSVHTITAENIESLKIGTDALLGFVKGVPVQKNTDADQLAVGTVGLLVLQRYQLLLLVSLIQLSSMPVNINSKENNSHSAISADEQGRYRVKLDEYCSTFSKTTIMQDLLMLFNSCQLVWFKKRVSLLLTNALAHPDGLITLVMLITKNGTIMASNVLVFVKKLCGLIPLSSILQQIRRIISSTPSSPSSKNQQSQSSMPAYLCKIAVIILEDLVIRKGEDEVFKSVLHPLPQSRLHPNITLTKPAMTSILCTFENLLEYGTGLESIREYLEWAACERLLLLYQACIKSNPAVAKPCLFPRIRLMLSEMFKSDIGLECLVQLVNHETEEKVFGYIVNKDDAFVSCTSVQFEPDTLVNLCRNSIISGSSGIRLLSQLVSTMSAAAKGNETSMEMIADLFEIFASDFPQHPVETTKLLEALQELSKLYPSISELAESIACHLHPSVSEQGQKATSTDAPQTELKRILSDCRNAEEAVSRAYALNELLTLIPTAPLSNLFKTPSMIERAFECILTCLQDSDPFVQTYANRVLKMLVQFDESNSWGMVDAMLMMVESSKVDKTLRKRVQESIHFFQTSASEDQHD